MFGLRERILAKVDPEPAPGTVTYRMPWWCAALPAVPWVLTGAVVSMVLLSRAPSAKVVPWHILVVYFAAPALLLVLIGHKLSRIHMIMADLDGIHWWPARRLRWADVIGAEVRTMLGARYLLLKRMHGRPYVIWWSPPGARNFVLQLLRVAPENSPVRKVVQQGNGAPGRV